MSPTRRRFVQYGLAAPALALGCGPKPGAATSTTPADATPSGPVKSLLVLGGTRFLGPAIVDAAVQAGLSVSLFNRGKSDPDAYPELERLVGDRDPEVGDGLQALRNRQWDAVIDTSGYFPRMVSASAELLAPNVGQYVFISSVSAYASHGTPEADEDTPLATLDDPTVEEMGPTYEFYGGLKVLCEKAVAKAMPEHFANVRPGYIVGPRDPTDRFTYWPLRVAQGGPMLAPGTADDPLQIIDVRDLGRWLVHLVQTRTTGTFNAVGPESPSTMGRVLDACAKASGATPTLKWASAAFLEAQSETEPVPVPIWAPPSGESAGFHQRSNARAKAAGLTFRSIDETVADTLAWFRTLPADRQAAPKAGLSPAREQALLAAMETMAAAPRAPRRAWQWPQAPAASRPA